METIKAMWEDAKMNAGYEICFMQNQKPEWMLSIINLFWMTWFTLKVLTLYQVCLLKGHDLIDEGYAGPDSGCIDMVCKRCGWSSRTWLY